MKILVIGGTRFFGKHMVAKLLEKGQDVTIATRGHAIDHFNNNVKRLIIERTNQENLREKLRRNHYDIVYDNLAYCSNDVKYVLDAVDCDKYIMTSSTAVYNKHIDTKEEDWSPYKKELIWCGRKEFPYDEGKRQAECALWQQYSHFNPIAVRFPFVIGSDDYTKRLYFYVEHIIKENPMYIDNYHEQMAFIRSDEAGGFLSFLAESNYSGAINGSSPQTISVKEIADYVKQKTGKAAILLPEGDEAPYNGEKEYSINIENAEKLGYSFTPLKEWIYELLDHYITEVTIG